MYPMFLNVPLLLSLRVQVRSANDRAQGAVRFSEELRERLGQDWIPKVQDWWSSMAGRVGVGGGGATPPPPQQQQRQGAAKEGSKESGPGPTGATSSSKEGRLFGWGLDLGAFSAFQQQLRPPSPPPEAVQQASEAQPMAPPPVAALGGGSGLVGQDPAAVRGDSGVSDPPGSPERGARPGDVTESGRTPADYESRDGFRYVQAAPAAGPLGSTQMGFSSTPTSVSAPASVPVAEALEHTGTQPVLRNVHDAAEVQLQLESAGAGSPVPSLGSPGPSASERDWREGPMSGSWEDLVSDPTRGTLPDSAGGNVLDVKD